jgi:hypothetical protein
MSLVDLNQNEFVTEDVISYLREMPIETESDKKQQEEEVS